MGLQNNYFNEGRNPRLVDTNSGTLGKTPLMEAAINGHYFVCDYLITEQNANLEARNNDQATPLLLAACFNKTEIVKLLLRHNANLEAKDSDKDSALMYAAIWNNTELLKVLLQHNPNIRARNNRGYHAAYLAAYYGHLEALKMLVEKDAAVVDLSGGNGETLLIAASKLGMADVCEYLVEEKNANTEIKDNVGRTALQHAKDPKIMKLLKNINQSNIVKNYKICYFKME